MNILVTGANGQLGNGMRIAATARTAVGSGLRFVFTDISQASEDQAGILRRLAGETVDVSTALLDITDLKAVRKAVKDNDINVIVNCAAYTDVDGAETNVELAGRLNADAPGNLATAMKETGGLLVQISTDYVFGREEYNTPCTEDRTGTPSGVYGVTKLRGERRIIESGCDHVIVRTAWLYSEFGKNFCKSILAAASRKNRIAVVFDQVGSPTYALDLAKAIMMVLEDYGRYDIYPNSGIYNFSNEGVCSWYDFAKMIQEYSGLTSCRVTPCHSSEYSSVVRRPSYSVLDKTKIKERFGVDVPYWTDSLKSCLRNILD